jgi:hypothetical protein
VGSVLAGHFYDLMQLKEPPALDVNQAYLAELEKLTAEAWLRGDYGTQE